MMKILYVEDNAANISLLQRIARMGGHEVINYTNGEHALNNFEQDHPDLVLMDLQLEGRVSGLEVVKALRERGFKTPIVAVTAYAMVGDRERCIEAGCDSYLSKPLPVAELVELVQKYEQRIEQGEAVTEVVKSVKPTLAEPAQPTVSAQPEASNAAPPETAANADAPMAAPEATATATTEATKSETSETPAEAASPISSADAVPTSAEPETRKA